MVPRAYNNICSLASSPPAVPHPGIRRAPARPELSSRMCRDCRLCGLLPLLLLKGFLVLGLAGLPQQQAEEEAADREADERDPQPHGEAVPVPLRGRHAHRPPGPGEYAPTERPVEQAEPRAAHLPGLLPLRHLLLGHLHGDSTSQRGSGNWPCAKLTRSVSEGKATPLADASG